MRCGRLKVIEGYDGVYHCMSRTVNGEIWFEMRDKEILRKMIWQVAEFSGVQVLTYCIMNNHFHLLVRVPCMRTLSDAELLRRYRLLYPRPTKYVTASHEVVEQMLREGGVKADALRTQLAARMGDVSEFMKSLKQRYTIWFNKSHGRFGTLWSERFKSVLVQGAGSPLQTVAAYIDLNPVRAGLVDDPKDYRFCGYTEAVAGNTYAVRGLALVWWSCLGFKSEVFSRMSPTLPKKVASAALQAHRCLLFGKGASPGDRSQANIDASAALKVLQEEDGVLPKSSLLRCRIRYFTDGKILGTAEFVRKWNKAGRSRGKAKPPIPLKEAAWGDLCVSNRLRSRVFG